MRPSEENKLFVQRFYDDLYNRGRLALADEYVGPDFVDHAAPMGTSAGPSALRSAIDRLRTAFRDHRYVIEDLIAEGDMVVAFITFSGTPARQSDASSTMARRIVRSEIHVLRVVDGKGVERWTARDDRQE